MISYMPWSEANFFLLILTITFVLFFWYKQPFRSLESMLHEIKDKETKSKLIGDSLVEGIIMTKDDGVILEANKAARKIFGYPPNALIGMNVVNLVPVHLRERHLEGMKRVAEGGPVTILGKTVDIDGLRMDGTLVPLALSVTKVTTTEGQFFTAVIRDVSERIMTQQRITELNQALSTRLAAMEAFNQSVCHDLNAPLRSIDGFSEILEQDYAEKFDAQGRDYLKRMRKGVIKMQQLVKDMMRLARVTQAETDLRIVSISLSNMFKTLLSETAMSDPQRKVEVKIQDDMEVNGDTELLALAISNLISNAWKYTRLNPNSVIEVGCNTVNDEKVYYIKDNGIGFDQNQAELLFKPFKRLHTEKEFEGSGIGLTIVKRVIELHKGRVWAEGVIDKGATFYFTIGT